MKHGWHITNGGTQAITDGEFDIGGSTSGPWHIGEDDYGFITNATTKINAKGGLPW